ncbi:entericidin A/B family lipoprotein [Salmonella enterica]|uniref:Entericidin A/B family lipoprotein n=1 Tax=Salmonella enterica I TaxID=59201 RepID=A0A5U3G2S2_SALET|nr:entericidin A/B family lipoprotein [Salmonella enterica]EBP4060098.1 entericidin A/B family lipoprotein [Salmonella enterica subsp. enterica]EDI0748298.1 entericidin A [Salmonella enterica subsp. enterica serovar Kisarawe]AXD45259.1 entericidin A [Salmonella enterica]EAS5877629.1 entericidin A/B family lipoprotein [Salmonella enterica]EAU6766194.1 entericidin A/B family lipoprotein [Salmonella enterica]
MVQRMLRHPIFRASMMKRACNTARGFGEDIQHLGHAISRAAS